ncbi:hypothetical protein [Actinomycetospora sp. NBC_00405]|uniref:hypothetical protein n=1 Tax=Actinomycetospora sp. NBC_00405 TaxID=2975952 RepID=UPI002E250622
MATSLAAHDGRLLRYVLEDLRYPVRWWEIMAMADLYGLAAANPAELARLPRQLYGSIEAVLGALPGAERRGDLTSARAGQRP